MIPSRKTVFRPPQCRRISTFVIAPRFIDVINRIRLVCLRGGKCPTLSCRYTITHFIYTIVIYYIFIIPVDRRTLPSREPSPTGDFMRASHYRCTCHIIIILCSYNDKSKFKTSGDSDLGHKMGDDVKRTKIQNI